jgi:hypothetical protein
MTAMGAKAYVRYEGQKRYNDPDRNTQFELMRQQQWCKGGGSF